MNKLGDLRRRCPSKVARIVARGSWADVLWGGSQLLVNNFALLRRTAIHTKANNMNNRMASNNRF